MLVIPAIDLLGGRCVRLTEGAFGSETVYSEDPVETARTFERQGATWIHVVDLDGAKAGQPMQTDVVERIVRAVKCNVQVGGGLRRLDDVDRALATGAHRAVVGSALAADERLAAAFVERFGEKIAAGIDTRAGKVAVHGWTATSAIRGPELASSLATIGYKTIVHTDVGRDGTLSGADVSVLEPYLGLDGVAVIASGGIATESDLEGLSRAGVAGAIIGKAIYEGRLSLEASVQKFQGATSL